MSPSVFFLSLTYNVQIAQVNSAIITVKLNQFEENCSKINSNQNKPPKQSMRSKLIINKKIKNNQIKR